MHGDPEETISAGQSFQDRASDTDPIKFLIACAAREGEPNTTRPDAK